MSDAECPYCGKDVEINHDDAYGYEEDRVFEQECDHCEKTFAYTTYIHFSYDTKQAECLNEGEHKYRKIVAGLGPSFSKLVCNICGKETSWKIEEDE